MLLYKGLRAKLWPQSPCTLHHQKKSCSSSEGLERTSHRFVKVSIIDQDFSFTSCRGLTFRSSLEQTISLQPRSCSALKTLQQLLTPTASSHSPSQRVGLASMLTLDIAPAGSLTGWRAHQELIDALPYVDPLTTSEQRAVDQLIEEEVSAS